MDSLTFRSWMEALHPFRQRKIPEIKKIICLKKRKPLPNVDLHFCILRINRASGLNFEGAEGHDPGFPYFKSPHKVFTSRVKIRNKINKSA